MSENLLMVKVGSNVIANSARTRLSYGNIATIAEDINDFERQNGDDEAHTILVSSGAFLASRRRGGVTNSQLDGMGVEERARFKQSRTDSASHRHLASAWAWKLDKQSLYTTIGELDLVTQSQRDNAGNRMQQMLNGGIIGIYNNDDQQSLRELDHAVTLHGERYHVMADNDYTTLSMARLAHSAGLFRDKNTQWGGVCATEATTTVVFLTHTNGVLQDIERPDSTIDMLSCREARQVGDASLAHATSSTSNGGMYSKLHCAADIAEETGARVVIANGRGRHALAKALNYENGTEILN